MKRSIFPAVLGVLLLAAACAAEHAVPRPAPGATGTAATNWNGRLPAPSLLVPALAAAPPRTAALAASDLQLNGADFSMHLPAANYAFSGTDALLQPHFGPGPEPDLAGLAFAIYDFDISGYEDQAAVHYDASYSNGAQVSDLWIGLADWAADRWDWLPASASQQADFAPLNNYVNFGGDLLVVLAAVGNGEIDVAGVRVGTLWPTAQLTADRTQGPWPLTVNFDASASSDPDGTLVQYQWDFDGDGSFDETTSEPTVQHVYSAEFSGQAQVQVLDDGGGTAQAHLGIQAYGPWRHTWGGVSWEYLAQPIVSQGYIYAVGQTDTAGFGAGSGDLLLVKYGLDGSLIWARTAGDQYDDYGNGLAADGDGNIYTVGRLGDFDNTYDALIQKWDPDGKLLWSRQWGKTGTRESFRAIQYAAGALFVCGETATMWPDGSALVMRFEPDGNLTWSRYWGKAEESEAADLTPIGTLFGGTTGIVVAGDTFSYGAGDVLYLRYDLDGNLITEKTWGSAGEDRGYAISGSIVTGATPIVGTINVGGDLDVLLLGIAGGTVNARFGSGDQEYGYGVLTDSMGGLYVCGYTYQFNPAASSDAFVQYIANDGSLGSGVYWQQTNFSEARFLGLCYAPDGQLLAAGDSNSADGNYLSLIATSLTPLAPSWVNRSLGTTTEPDGYLNTGGDNVEDITAAVQDTGGGYTDGLLAYLPKP